MMIRLLIALGITLLIALPLHHSLDGYTWFIPHVGGYHLQLNAVTP